MLLIENVFYKLKLNVWINCINDEAEYDHTSGLYYKTFGIVIYDRNDSTIVEPVL